MTLEQIESLLTQLQIQIAQNTAAIDNIKNAYATTDDVTAINDQVKRLVQNNTVILEDVAALSNTINKIDHLEKLKDIHIRNLSDGDILQYDAASGKWYNVKATLSGYDDILTEFPEAVRKIKKIKYNSHLGNYGNINNKGLSEIGPLGLRDYGTGVHEATHAYDMAMSQYGKHDFSESVVEQARKNLKLRKGTKEYKALLVQVTGDYAYIDKALEVFAYAVETAKGGVNNMFATEVYRIIGGKK